MLRARKYAENFVLMKLQETKTLITKERTIEHCIFKAVS